MKLADETASHHGAPSGKKDVGFAVGGNPPVRQLDRNGAVGKNTGGLGLEQLDGIASGAHLGFPRGSLGLI